jgi:hypothetical protein
MTPKLKFLDVWMLWLSTAIAIAAFILAMKYGVSRQAAAGWAAIAAVVMLLVSWLVVVFLTGGDMYGGSQLADEIGDLANWKAAMFAFTLVFLATCASAKVSASVATGLLLIIIISFTYQWLKLRLRFQARDWFWASVTPMIALLVAGPMIRYGLKFDKSMYLVLAAVIILVGLIIQTKWLSAGHRKIEEAAAK